jgi:hypothetical protein
MGPDLNSALEWILAMALNNFAIRLLHPPRYRRVNSILCFCISLIGVSALAMPAVAYQANSNPDGNSLAQPWRASFGEVNRDTAAVSDKPNLPGEAVPQANPPASATAQDEPGPSTTKVTRNLNSLPNSSGQVWREYDISPYTSRITNTENPQQAIIDWIQKETGVEMWFNHPLGILSATKNQLYVYHTPEVQETIHKMVDRFVYTRGQVQSMDVTLLTIDNPNWRSSAYSKIQPIKSQSLGVEAFILSKENAAILIHQLARRGDAKLVNAGTVNNHDGQPFLLRNTRLTQFFNQLQWVPNQTPNYHPLTANVDEGYSVSINCLSSLDGRTIEAIVKCDIDQIERLTNVKVDAPSNFGTVQSVNLQIPQIVSWRLHERFRWSNDQVLLLTCGVVSGIDPNEQKTGPIIPLLANTLKTKRAEAILFIDYRGPVREASLPTANDGMVPIVPRR